MPMPMPLPMPIPIPIPIPMPMPMPMPMHRCPLSRLTPHYSLLTKARFEHEMMAQMPAFASLAMFRSYGDIGLNEVYLNEVCLLAYSPPSCDS
jgi:hypothetical protein